MKHTQLLEEVKKIKIFNKKDGLIGKTKNGDFVHLSDPEYDSYCGIIDMSKKELLKNLLATTKYDLIELGVFSKEPGNIPRYYYTGYDRRKV